MRTPAAEAARAGIDPRRYTIDHRANSVNPRTGAGEFGFRIRYPLAPATPRSYPSPSWMDTIEGGMASTLQFLKDLGFEFLPDGSLKGPNGEIIPFGTQVVEAAQPTRRRPTRPDNQDSPGLRETLRQNARDLIQNLTGNAFTEDELDRIAGSIESNFRLFSLFGQDDRDLANIDTNANPIVVNEEQGNSIARFVKNLPVDLRPKFTDALRRAIEDGKLVCGNCLNPG
ncbi:MAG: hypothetical protein SFV19_06540 [Rhodospirillaceae bacterium]|nr:hypothetical protein [Rhodospirillaceae bacterium]